MLWRLERFKVDTSIVSVSPPVKNVVVIFRINECKYSNVYYVLHRLKYRQNKLQFLKIEILCVNVYKQSYQKVMTNHMNSVRNYYTKQILNMESKYKTTIVKKLVLIRKYKDEPEKKKLLEKEVTVWTKKLDNLYLRYPLIHDLNAK